MLSAARAVTLTSGLPCTDYRLSWKFEAVRTCEALKGLRSTCSEDDRNYFCQHSPQCPAMCKAIHEWWCKARLSKLRYSSTPPWERISASDVDMTDFVSAVEKDRIAVDSAEPEEPTPPCGSRQKRFCSSPCKWEKNRIGVEGVCAFPGIAKVKRAFFRGWDLVVRVWFGLD